VTLLTYQTPHTGVWFVRPKPQSRREHHQPGWGLVTIRYITHHASETVMNDYQAIGLLVPVSSTPYSASTSGLSTPSSLGSLTHPKVHGDLILRPASRLDAFSGYPSRT